MKKLLIVLTILVACSAGAQADVIWDQSDYDAIGMWGLWDSVSGCAPFGGSIHYASDVPIFDQVTITSISTYYTPFNFDTGSAFQAYLLITPKTGAIPVDGVDLPQENGTLVNITSVADGNGIWVIKADGLSVSLNPGEYWISLTPILPGGPWGPDFHIISLSPWGDPSAYYEYCGQFASAWTPNVDSVDGSILVEGTVDVVPTNDATWSEMKALFR